MNEKPEKTTKETNVKPLIALLYFLLKNNENRYQV
jgi:hypothetical protein